jgi:hypothetical protein
MTGALALVAALSISSQIQTHPAGLDSIGPSRARSLRTAPIMDKLYQQANKPALDFNFARFKDLHDDATGKTSLVTFSRSAAQSPGTYVGSDGLIHDAPVNLALYSEQFDDAAWSKETGVTVTANQTIAPDGKQTADRVSSTAEKGLWQTKVLGAGTYTFSVYLKATASTTGLIGRIYPGDMQSIAITTEWQRFDFTFTLSGSTTTYPQIRQSSDFGVADIFIWGAQLQETDAATMAPTAYVHTTSQALAAPRFDHDPVTGESLGLLVEEQRANAFTESEFRNGYLADSALRSGLLSDVSFSGLFENTGVAFGHDGATVSYVYKIGVATSSTVTFSVFVRMDDGGAPSFGSSGATNSSNDFVIVLGALVASPLTYSVEDYGNGMYRVSVTATSGTASANTGILKYNTNSSRTFKVSGYQVENSASFPTSYIPTTGSSQTRYADVAAVQDEDFSTTNLLAYSESFDVGWANIRSIDTPNAAIAPDGTLSADYIEQSPSFTIQGGVQTTASSVPSTGTYAQSVYAKAGEKNFLIIGSTSLGAWFDLQNGVVGTVITGSASIQNAGNGWYRCTWIASFSSGNQPVFQIADTDGSATVTPSGGIYLWGASLTATEYPVAYTTTRNLLTDSQDFERSAWVKTRTTVEDDVAQAPDGTLTADRIKEDSTPSSTHRFDRSAALSPAIPIGTVATFTVYAKPDGRNWILLEMQGGLGSGYAWFDIANGAVGSTVNLSGAATITNVGNGWYRCSITDTTTGTSAQIADVFLATANGVSSYSGDGTSGVLLWGAQLEPGSTATDYVRTVDVVGKDYGWYEPTEGTVFVEYENETVTQDIVKFHAGSLSNSFATYNAGGTSPVLFMRTSGANQAIIGVGALSSPFSTSFAIKYNDTNTASNGVVGTTDTSTILPIVETVDFGSSSVNVGGGSLSKHIKRLTYWPVRQSDSTLQVITQ